MSALSRLGDLGEGSCPATDHDDYITQYITGASTVFINNLPATKLGSLGDQSCGHVSMALTGSPSVFVENVPVHRVGDIGEGGAGGVYVGISGSSNVFNDGSGTVTAIAPPDPPITIAPATQAAADTAVSTYIATPGAYPLDSNDNSPPGQPGQVKGNYAGTVDDGGQGASDIHPTSPEVAGSGDLVTFLAKVLAEAGRGVWSETGQGGNPSNPNITGIWRSLGYPASGCWASDQTAWCMGFVNYALKNTGHRYLQTARAYDIRDKTSSYGATSVPISQAQPGDIALWSYSHVNFVYTNTGGKLTFVGGNQAPKASNNPNDGSITQSWPGGYTPPGNGTLIAVFRPSKV